MKSIIQNYNKLKDEIIDYARFTIVTKGIDEGILMDFIKETKHEFFAENYTKELKKWHNIKEEFPFVNLSFIGSFQSGNIRTICKYCDSIQTISSFKAFEKVQNEILKKNLQIKLYLQVNIGEEKQKNGFMPYEITADFGKFFSGMMCIPPVNQKPDYYFNKMKEISKITGISWMSMGMSKDYKTAINYNTSEVRIGSAIFK